MGRSFDYRSKSDSEITNNKVINHRTTIQYNTRANKNIYWLKTRRHGLGKSLIRSSIYAKLYLFVFSFSLVNLLWNPELIIIKLIGSDFLTDLFCRKLCSKVYHSISTCLFHMTDLPLWLCFNRVFLTLTKDTNGFYFRFKTTMVTENRLSKLIKSINMSVALRHFVLLVAP